MASRNKQFSITLNELLKGYFSVGNSDNAEKLNDITINGLSLDSRETNVGDLFIAISGEKVNGVEFINNAIENGAAAVLWETNADVDAIQINWRKSTGQLDVPIIAIANLTQLVGEIADRFYSHPSDKLIVCGVTGTNGKTSCADFIAQMISINEPCGLLGTLGKGLYPDLEETGYTTPDAISCHAWLADIATAKAKYAVMEVSSHALTQGRVNGIHFNSAIFTNLSRDHLDFHGDMENYINAKSKLFEFPELKNAIINVDDEVGRNIADNLTDNIRCIRYGLNKLYTPDVFAYDLKLDQDGLSMSVKTPWGEGELTSPIMGRFNASNLLAVLSFMLLQGLELNDALNRLSKIESVPGRMQRLGGNELPLVIVDFAHTPDALEQVLNSLRQHTQHNLWCVFGCGGDRDTGKRSLMGAIAEDKSDYVILTNDNPRSEAPEKIINDIKAGIVSLNKVMIEPDRHAAIQFAVSNAKAGDVVLIAGKGHENYQLIGDKKYPFNDAEEVQQQLEACAG